VQQSFNIKFAAVADEVGDTGGIAAVADEVGDTDGIAAVADEVGDTDGIAAVADGVGDTDGIAVIKYADVVGVIDGVNEVGADCVDDTDGTCNDGVINTYVIFSYLR